MRYAAFLRAINVGGHTVAMARLREALAPLGLEGLQTVIASGNVLFESPEEDAAALEGAMERALGAGLGFEVAAFVRSQAEVEGIARYRPFGEGAEEADGVRLHIAFTRAEPGEEARAALEAVQTEDDRLRVHGREVYYLRRGGLHDAPVSGVWLERTLGMPATMRAATTVRRIAARWT
jgi:uncharacterized protein (DUF1697 family)